MYPTLLLFTLGLWPKATTRSMIEIELNLIYIYIYEILINSVILRTTISNLSITGMTYCILRRELSGFNVYF